MERPPEILKPFAKRLANLAVSDGGAEMTRLLYLAGLMSTKPASVEQFTSTPPGANGADGNHVGIWERKEESGKSYFVRSNKMRDDWTLWANVNRINPKQRPRVLWLGESVARGYLYDPQHTPAMVLESMLRSQLGEDGIEVVDLARTNLNMDMLADLARCTLALQPDAIVIFAGNNWHPAAFDLDGRRSAAATLRDGGVKALKEYAEDGLRSYVKSLVKNVAQTYAAANIPVVWLVPEFNLADWRDPEGIVPSLDGAAPEWADCWRRSRAALQENNTDDAASLARKMVQLDGGTSPTAFYVLAECALRTGDHVARRRYLESARDASVWDVAAYLTPRPYSVGQEALREEAERQGIAVVDLPQIYSTYLRGESPDRRLFLDYVHLNAEGIRITTAAAASCLLKQLKGINVSLEVLAGKAQMPKPQVEAEANFLAAIHNAHHGQSYDVIREHCSRAVEASTEIAGVMHPFIDMQTRRAPFWMCKSAEQLAMMQSPSVPQYLFGGNVQLLDTLLIDAVVEALKKTGIDAQTEVAELRRQEHSVKGSACNMLDYYYCMTTPLQRGLSWNLPLIFKTSGINHYYKAYEADSRFFFVGEKSVSVELSLTYRVPDAGSADAELVVEVNRKTVGTAAIGREWQTWSVVVAGEAVHDGVNEVVIHWPEVKHDHPALIERAAADMERGEYPDLHPVLGEVHTFVASAAQASQQ